MSDPVEDRPLRRWSIVNGSAIPDAEGRLMLHADHVAAVQAARQAERERIREARDEWKRTVMHTEHDGYVTLTRHALNDLLDVIDGASDDS